MTAESLFQKTAILLREGAEMARANAEASRRDGDERSASEAERRAALWEAWAERELIMEQWFEEKDDERHDIAA